jgi:hypothetical protein
MRAISPNVIRCEDSLRTKGEWLTSTVHMSFADQLQIIADRASGSITYLGDFGDLGCNILFRYQSCAAHQGCKLTGSILILLMMSRRLRLVHSVHTG